MTDQYYVSLDPGKTTGWATFREDGWFTNRGQVDLDDLPEFLESLDGTKVIIYENYKLFSWKAKQQSGSNMPASQAIGMIKSYALRNDCHLIDQPPSIKPTAQMLSQLTPIGKHSETHWVDAYNHGFYYLHNKGLVKSALEEKLSREKAEEAGEGSR